MNNDISMHADKYTTPSHNYVHGGKSDILVKQLLNHFKT